MATIRWRGGDIERRLEAAAVAALEEIATLAVATAKPLTPVRTGRLRASEHAEPVRRDGRRLYVRWGAYTEYARYVELGTVRMRPRYFLRRAAAQAYPLLPGAIRRRMR